MSDTKFPATCIVHWPGGPVACCDKHAKDLIGLGKFMGGHVVATKLVEPAECTNCANEATEGLAP